MSLTIIFLLIALGMLLILLEIFAIPGTSVFGIVGAVLIIFAVWQSYKIYGSDKGHIILLVVIVLIGATMVFAFKSNTWKRMMLNTNIDGKVNVIEEEKLHIGDMGKAVSRISPAGTAIFGNDLFEVHTNGEFIDQETEIIITKLENNKIFVKRK